jgi:hypothetical protein
MTCLIAPHIWRRSADVAVVDHEDRVVALNLNEPSAPPVVLEGTAATIWHLLDDFDTEEALVHAVARTYDVHPSSVGPHIHRFLLQVNHLGLVTSGDR